MGAVISLLKATIAFERGDLQQAHALAEASGAAFDRADADLFYRRLLRDLRSSIESKTTLSTPQASARPR